MKRILTIFALILGLCPSAALADFNATAGSGLVVFGFTCFSTKVCTAWVPINSAGTELFTGANPGIAAGSGTAGTAATGVLTVQGIASMTPLIVTNSGTFAVQAAQSGTWNVTNISGTVSLPTGAATAANQATEISSLATIATNTGLAIPAQSNHTTNIGAVDSINQYPATSVPYTASATGTTAATTATLAGAASVTTYICGLSIRANATAAATGNATVTGTITGTLNFTQWTAPNASGLGVTEQIFAPCVPASATNTSIAVVSAAPGTGGVVSVTAWGYKL